ncbi:MAG: nicotinate (nicotinamide) nucleotide adenylyltransferase [Candidatus Eremiobacteraeota bacterium]|nr:nicotinate (nicotinamide) nucleotide adenylyltransferase [Candidatus Eremiobacteraeota bacterium]
MKLGIFGGTFDPIHNAHLFVAESARRLESLDRVIFVPTQRARHRERAHADASARCTMIVRAIAGNPYFALDRTDLADDASGYTADLLPRLQERYPNGNLTFIAGADSLASNAWVRLDEVLSVLEHFVIAPRSGSTQEGLRAVLQALPQHLREKVRTLDLPEIPESGSVIRRLLGEGKSIRYLVPEPVWRYVHEHNLYGELRVTV